MAGARVAVRARVIDRRVGVGGRQSAIAVLSNEDMAHQAQGLREKSTRIFIVMAQLHKSFMQS